MSTRVFHVMQNMFNRNQTIYELKITLSSNLETFFVIIQMSHEIKTVPSKNRLWEINRKH